MKSKKTEKGNRQVLPWLDSLILYGPFVLAALVFLVCLYIELTHMELSQEFRDGFYSDFGGFTYYLSILLSTVYGRKYGVGWIRSAIYSWLCFLLVFGTVSVAWKDLDLIFFNSASVGSFRSLLVLPLFCIIPALIEKRNVLTLCDYLTPYFLYRHGIVTSPCWISGCCAGAPMSWGLLNPVDGTFRFPAQPCIVVVTVLIALWGLFRARKRNYETYGEIFGISMIAYGIFRYALEFFTDDIRIFGKFSLYSIYSLLMILMGLVVLQLEKRIPKKYMRKEQEKTSMEENL